jgi:hypothetical protein
LLDADDTFYPEKLNKVVGAFQKFGLSGICIHQVIKIDKEGRAFSYPRPVTFIEGWVAAEALRSGGLIKNFPPASGISFRRPVTDLFFPVPVSLRRVVDAYLAHTAKFFTETCAVHDVLTKYRIHGENISSMGDFSAVPVGRFIEDLKLLIVLMKHMLAAHYGSEVADQLRLEDNSHYWSFLLVLHILSGNSSNEVCGEPLQRVVESIRPYRQSLLARLLLALPRGVAERAIQYWAGQSPKHSMIVQTARSFLRV